jgi:hypothetical protein
MYQHEQDIKKIGLALKAAGYDASKHKDIGDAIKASLIALDTSVEFDFAQNLALEMFKGAIPKEEYGSLIAIFGESGTGKSTFCARKECFFLDVEDGIHRTGGKLIADEKRTTVVNKSDVIESWESYLAGFEKACQSNYSHIIVDTVDALEQLLWQSLARRNSWASIAKSPFKSGYEMAADAMNAHLQICKRVRKHGKTLIFLGHCSVKSYNNPEGESYDRCAINLEKRVETHFQAAMDAILFLTFEPIVSVNKDDGRFIAKTSGDRLAICGESLAYKTKNRFDLPKKVPVNRLWASIFTQK